MRSAPVGKIRSIFDGKEIAAPMALDKAHRAQWTPRPGTPVAARAIAQ